jgi:hypothetical protein
MTLLDLVSGYQHFEKKKNILHPASTLKKQGAGSFEKLVPTCKTTIDTFTWKAKTSNR